MKKHTLVRECVSMQAATVPGADAGVSMESRNMIRNFRHTKKPCLILVIGMLVLIVESASCNTSDLDQRYDDK